jgi:hypothetical protein
MIARLKRLGADRGFAIGNVAVAGAVALAVFRMLPGRSLGVTVVALGIVVLLLASSAGLAMRASWAARVSVAAAAVLLAAGALLLAGLTLGLTFWHGVAGSGAPGLLVLVAALLGIVPYAIAYPIGLMIWLQGRAPRSAEPGP